MGAANGGLVGTFTLPDLRTEFADAIKNVKVGGVTDLIRSDEGYQILRVDARTPASDPLAFDEDKVREAITVERREKERAAYMKSLRKDAYIKLAPEYQSTVGPLISVDAPTARSTAATTTNKSESNGSKKP
jgi:parvulin-like peptidyl-prolyl isomerase